MFITQRVKAAVQAFRNPQATKSFGGSMDGFYGGAPGLTSRNQDLTFTEAGAATAFGIIVEVQRGVMFIADSISMLPAGIYDSRTDELLISLDTREELNVWTPGATFVQAIRQYERQWKHDFFDRITFSDWLYGETFVARLLNAKGGVAGLRWLNPLYTRPQIMRGRIERYDYSGDDGYYQILRDSMAYRIHHANPYDDLRGISPVLSALPSMNISRNAERGVMGYFKNGMILGGMMMPESDTTNLSGPQMTKLERDMKQHHQGVDNAWRWVLAPVRMAMQAFDQPDLQKNYSVSKDAAKKIMMALGVPPELAGNPDSVSYDNADKIMRNWLRVNGRSYANKVEGFVNTSLLPYFEPTRSVYFKFDFTQIDQQDAALVQADFDKGMIPYNVVQAQRGYEVDEDLKDIYILGGKPIHKDVLIQVSRDPAAFGAVTPTPLMLHMPGQPPGQLPAPPTIPGLTAGTLPEEPTDPQKGAASLCVMLDLKNNPDLIDLQKRLKALYPDPTIKWNDPAEFHITMVYVPAVDDEQIAAVVDALPDLSAEGLSLKVGQLNCFDNVGEHALHFRIARNSALSDLQASVYDACDINGLQMSGYSNPAQYTPHVTMGYLPEKIGRITFHGKVAIAPAGIICSVERGGKYETVWPVEESDTENAVLDPAQETAKTVMLNVHDGHTHDLPIARRDYSPDKALAELKAWQTFTARGKSSRPFVFTMLKGDPADYIAERLAAGDAPSEIVKTLKPRFDGSRLKVLQAIAEDMFVYLSGGTSEEIVKSIASLEHDFSGRFNSMLKDFRNEKPRNPGKASDILKFLNQNFIRSGFIEGMNAGGVTDEPDDDDNVAIRKLVDDANSYVSSFVDTLYGDGISDAQAALKAGQWWKKGILPAYYAGFESAKANALMVFTGRDGVDSCAQCTRWWGVKRRLKWWTKNKLRPQVDTESFDCGGYECNHYLDEVTGKAD
jgi:HK97 family phage portal protein/2'-5' RNA ligase